MDRETVKSLGVVALFAILMYVIFTNAWIIKGLVSGYGIVGLFLASAIANATVFLPLPIDLLILASADTLGLNEVLVAAIALGLGAAVGEMTAYITGRLGGNAIKALGITEFGKLDQIREKIGEKGAYFIFIGALVPFPFDLIGVSAGLIKFDWRKFFLAALFGKTIRYIVIGLAGYFGFALVRGMIGAA